MGRIDQPAASNSFDKELMALGGWVAENSAAEQTAASPADLRAREPELLEACRRGDRDAFRELFEAWRDRIYSIALRYTGNEAAAMDVAQDAFVKLFDSIHTFRGESSFQTWVFRLVVNRCFDHRRRNRRLVPIPEGFLSTLRAAADSLADLVRSEQCETVRAAVDRLAPHLRLVVTLRYTEGMAYEEIAAVLGCSPGTVASRLNRAHKALERKLVRFAPGNGDWHV